MGNGDGMKNGRRDEGREEIRSWFPLLDLFWDDGQSGISPTEAEVGYGEGRRGGEGGRGRERNDNDNENGVGNGHSMVNVLENNQWEEEEEEIISWYPL